MFFRAACGDDHKLATTYFLLGGYDRVAEIDGEDEIFAFRATQNGALSDSWSQEPPEGVHPCEPSFHLLDGERIGRKSTEVGDVLMVNNATFFVIDTFGVARLKLTVQEAMQVMTRLPEAPIVQNNVIDDSMVEKVRSLDLNIRNWRNLTYPNGSRMFAKDGTLLNDQGNRSIFDDVDE